MGTTIFDVNFTKAEPTSTLRVLVYANLSSPDDVQFQADIVLDNIVRQTCSANIILDGYNSNGRIPLSPFAFLTGIPGGPHNVKLIIYNNETDNVSLSILPGATIEVTELKQGAM